VAASKEILEEKVKDQIVPLEQIHKVRVVKSTCLKIDLNIKRKEIILKVLVTKNTTIKRDKDRREVTKKEDLNHIIRSRGWENHRIRAYQT
jgi:hypothetical protein